MNARNRQKVDSTFIKLLVRDVRLGAIDQHIHIVLVLFRQDLRAMRDRLVQMTRLQMRDKM
jgi:hypothetical protein